MIAAFCPPIGPCIPSGGDIAKSALDSVGSAIAGGLQSTASFVAANLSDALKATTSINLTSGFFVTGRSAAVTGILTQMALWLMLALVVVVAIQGVIHASPSMGLRALFIDVPISLFALGVVGFGLQALSVLVDQVTNALFGTVGGDLGAFVTAGVKNPANVPSAGFLAPLLLGMFLVACLVLLFEMALRTAAVYFLAALMPLALAARIWPSARAVWHKLLEAIIVLIVAKLAIVAAIAIGAAIVADGGVSVLGSLMSRVIGIGILMVACYTPRMLFRLVPRMELAIVAASTMKGGATAAAGMAVAAPAAANRLAGVTASTPKSTTTTPAAAAATNSSTPSASSAPNTTVNNTATTSQNVAPAGPTVDASGFREPHPPVPPAPPAVPSPAGNTSSTERTQP